jgi:thioredoxin-related protein
MGKKVNIARIDATVNQKMAQKYQIRGFPTMLMFEVDGK